MRRLPRVNSTVPLPIGRWRRRVLAKHIRPPLFSMASSSPAIPLTTSSGALSGMHPWRMVCSVSLFSRWRVTAPAVRHVKHSPDRGLGGTPFFREPGERGRGSSAGLLPRSSARLVCATPEKGDHAAYQPQSQMRAITTGPGESADQVGPSRFRPANRPISSARSPPLRCGSLEEKSWRAPCS